ncbi:MAG: DUF427 domain-containing protein [Acidimicrobiales bacterium]
MPQRVNHIEDSAKRVRVYLGGEVVADTTRPRLVWEIPHFPQYYFPVDDVRSELLVATGATTHSPSRGDGKVFTVKAGDREAVNAAWRFDSSPIEGLREYIRFEWEAMDAWFEEDEEVFVHPRDPHHRVDILASSRHVRVELDGVTLAESSSPRLLFETSLPVRYYLPKPDVRLDLLVPSETVTSCPYKGTTVHLSADIDGTVRPDVAWSYQAPVLESVKIAGLVCFYNERVDLYVDGERLERPDTPWS